MRLEQEEILPLPLIVEASRKVLDVEMADLLARFDRVFGEPRDAGIKSVLEELKAGHYDDTPQTRHWVTTTRSLLRSKYRSLDPEPQAVSHFFVDSLLPDRVIELHRLRALELVVQWRVARGLEFEFQFNNEMPRDLHLGDIGVLTVERSGARRRWAIGGDDKKLVITAGRRARSLVVSGSRRRNTRKDDWIHPLVAETAFGPMIIPTHDPALSATIWSHAPIVRGDEAVSAWKGVLEHAVELVRDTRPGTAEDTVKLCKSVLPLHAGETGYGSSSREEILGLVHLPAVESPLDVAECLVHEGLHQRLFRAEAGSRLIENEGDDEIYYSPWRSDGRPLRMLLHGAFVFVGVSELWNAYSGRLLKQHDSSKEIAAFHVYYRSRQARVALEILRKYGRLSSLGEHVASETERRAKELLDRLAVRQELVNEAEGRLRDHADRFKHYVH